MVNEVSLESEESCKVRQLAKKCKYSFSLGV